MSRSATVVGFDPGLRHTGYAVVQGTGPSFLVQECGVIRPRTGLALEQRLAEIYRLARSVLEAHEPDLVALEDVYAASRFPQAAIRIGYVRGVLYLAAAHCGVRVVSVPPAEVKRAVTGYGRAPKAQVQAAIRSLLARSVLPEGISHHTSDALALAATVLRRAT